VARKRKVSAESNGDTAAVENIASTAVQWYRVNAIPQVATDSVVSAVNSAAVSGRIKMLADRMPCSIAVRGFAACDVIGSNDEGSIVAVERFVYILADDLGWNDVGFHRGALRTPNLDRLAAEGAALNSFYVQPYSSQTRAALLTGRYPLRYGRQTLTILPADRYGLPPEERTLAQLLKENGYRTAFIGTWLLGHAKPLLAHAPRLRPLLRIAFRTGRAGVAQNRQDRLAAR